MHDFLTWLLWHAATSKCFLLLCFLTQGHHDNHKTTNFQLIQHHNFGPLHLKRFMTLHISLVSSISSLPYFLPVKCGGFTSHLKVCVQIADQSSDIPQSSVWLQNSREFSKAPEGLQGEHSSLAEELCLRSVVYTYSQAESQCPCGSWLSSSGSWDCISPGFHHATHGTAFMLLNHVIPRVGMYQLVVLFRSSLPSPFTLPSPPLSVFLSLLQTHIRPIVMITARST